MTSQAKLPTGTTSRQMTRSTSLQAAMKMTNMELKLKKKFLLLNLANKELLRDTSKDMEKLTKMMTKKSATSVKMRSKRKKLTKRTNSKNKSKRSRSPGEEDLPRLLLLNPMSRPPTPDLKEDPVSLQEVQALRTTMRC